MVFMIPDSVSVKMATCAVFFAPATWSMMALAQSSCGSLLGVVPRLKNSPRTEPVADNDSIGEDVAFDWCCLAIVVYLILVYRQVPTVVMKKSQFLLAPQI